jgi:hypothetical protein
MSKLTCAALQLCIPVLACDDEREYEQSDKLVTVDAPKSETPNPDRFVGRDGLAEAEADIQKSKSTKLYFHVFNGFAPDFRFPGLKGCWPQHSGPVIFEMIPELAFSEGTKPLPPADNAYKFASDYNRTMFAERSQSVKSACPDATLD